MKKALFLTIFLTLAAFSFADNLPNRTLFIEGNTDNENHLMFFMNHFRMEASALGFTVVDEESDAGYTFRFDVQSYMDYNDPSKEFIILISLILNDENREIVSFGWPFSGIDEMLEYNQFVFYKAAVLIPGIGENNAPIVKINDDRWKNKWIYLRISGEYPVTSYILQNDGLYFGSYVYEGNITSPVSYSHIDNKVFALPGATVGLEFQLLPFLSLEGNFQISFGDTRENWYPNMAVGGQIKFPLKFFTNYMIEPYGAFLYDLKPSDVFEKFPKYFIGGGIQFGTKGGNIGAFFLDVNFMLPLPVQDNADVVMYNPYGVKYFDPTLWENPSGIHYKRFVVGIGIGYKFGFLNRKWNF